MLAWVAVCFIALLSIVPRLIALDIPLTRDEGAYAYVSEVISRGGLPYVTAFDHKPPSIYYLYKLSFYLFGHGPGAPRLLAALFLFVSAILAYSIVKKITDNFWAALGAMPLLIFATMSPAYGGVLAQPELFVIPFLLAGFLLLLDENIHTDKLFCAGLVFGSAFMIKQPVALIAAVLFFCFMTKRLLCKNMSLHLFLAYLGGAILPFLLWWGYFALNGGGREFWMGAFDYNFGYSSVTSFRQSCIFFITRFNSVLLHDWITWFAGGVGILVFLIFSPKTYQRWLFMSGVASSAVTVTMGRYFYGHYFLYLVVFLALGIALGIGSIPRKIPPAVSWVIIVCILIVSLRSNALPSVSRDSVTQRETYGYLPSLSSTVGNYLSSHGANGKTAFIIGSEAQILFSSKLTAPSRFFYFYPLMIPTRSIKAYRSELMADLQRTAPDYLLLVTDTTSHLISDGISDQFIFTLLEHFSQYELTGYITSGMTHVDTEIKSLSLLSDMIIPSSIYIFQKPEQPNLSGKLRFGTMLRL